MTPEATHTCFLVQLKLEDRSVVPRDVVRHMRSTVSPASHPGGLLAGGLGGRRGGRRQCRLSPCLLLPGQPVRHRDRRPHRLRRQAHRHQLRRVPRQQQGPAARLGEPPPGSPPPLPPPEPSCAPVPAIQTRGQGSPCVSSPSAVAGVALLA